MIDQWNNRIFILLINQDPTFVKAEIKIYFWSLLPKLVASAEQITICIGIQ